MCLAIGRRLHRVDGHDLKKMIMLIMLLPYHEIYILFFCSFRSWANTLPLPPESDLEETPSSWFLPVSTEPSRFTEARRSCNWTTLWTRVQAATWLLRQWIKNTYFGFFNNYHTVGITRGTNAHLSSLCHNWKPVNSVTGVCECRENFFLFKHQVFIFDVNIETIFCPFQVSGVGLQGGEWEVLFLRINEYEQLSTSKH